MNSIKNMPEAVIEVSNFHEALRVSNELKFILGPYVKGRPARLDQARRILHNAQHVTHRRKVCHNVFFEWEFN